MKKSIAIILCLVMILALSLPAAAASKTTVKDNSKFTINISSWFMGDLKDKTNLQLPFYNYYVAEYKKLYPNATVVLNNIPNEKYMDVIRAKMASSSADEIVYHQNLVLFSKAGYLMDLTKFPFVPKLNDAGKATVTYNGKIYALPQTMTTFGCFYNKKMFADNKIKVPANWTEFLAACETLKKAGITPLGGGFKDNWVTQQTFGYIFMPNFILDTKPNYLVDLYNGKAKFNSPEFKNAVSKFGELAAKGYFQKAIFSTDWMTSGQEFSDGKYAMLIQGAWFPGMLDSTFKGNVKSKDTGYFPIAGPSGKPIISLSTDHYLSINANVKNKTHAIDLFNCMTNDQAMNLTCRNQAFPGINVPVQHTIPAYADIQNALKTNKTTVPGIQYFPGSVQNGEYTTILQKALAGKAIPDSEYAAADSTYRKDIALAQAP